MAFWKIVTLACTTSIIADAKWIHQKRDIHSDICAPYNNTNKIQCYCKKDNKEPPSIQNAECYVAEATVQIDDQAWSSFKTLNSAPKIVFTNNKGIPLSYIPTEALKETTALVKLDIKHGTINTIGSFAFANHSILEEITLRDDQITVLDPYSFINHNHLKIISLDTNNIAEINRNVFVELPALEFLYLTNNKISTIHDRAFVHLESLKELEIDRNKVFSLNFASFEGLNNLEKLDLSSNSLEVIGENTFHALAKLRSLNLDGNKIQMLDDKAFNGLGKVLSLSLAHNKLIDIDSDKVFVGLDSLISLSLKSNQIKEIKNAAMAPILNNFYGNNSVLDVEDNNFPCDCRLDWFMSLMNKTLNKHLKNTIENLKCVPDSKLKEIWDKTPQVDNASQTIEDEPPAQGADYEYYDETQLNGKLFYLDVRLELNCDKDTSVKSETKIEAATKDNANLVSEKSIIDNEGGNLDLHSKANNTISIVTNEISKSLKNKRDKNDDQAFTTTRLATVSAKPEQTRIYEHMASDEAQPDKIKAQSSIQEGSERSSGNGEDSKASNANKNFGCVSLLMFTVLIYFRI